MIELLCGLIPRLETSWAELDTSFAGALRDECLPHRLSADAKWHTIIANAVRLQPGVMQLALQPDETLGDDGLW